MCYPFGGTGARTTVAVPNGSVTVQLTAFVARPLFWPYVLVKIVTPSALKVIDSRTMCWSSTHRLAESPGVPTTVIVPSAHSTMNVSRPCPGGASAMAGDAGNATAAAVNAPSARSRFMCSPVDEVAVDIHYPARNVIQSRVERFARADAGPGLKAASPWSARNAGANRHRGQQAATA